MCFLDYKETTGYDDFEKILMVACCSTLKWNFQKYKMSKDHWDKCFVASEVSTEFLAPKDLQEMKNKVKPS